MSREIKFRAWHEGFQGQEPQMLYDTKLGDCLVWKSQGQNISDIMQFTGLKDKNGKEIYEGDLLTSEFTHLFRDEDIKKKPCEVTWKEEYGGFYLTLEKRSTGLSEYLEGWKSGVFEVIGNIHENPELVEKKAV